MGSAGIVLVAVVVVVVAVPLIVARTIIARGKARAGRELTTLGPLARLTDAAFLGLRSKGAAQMRGNDCLALTEARTLVFLSWGGTADLHIERDQITDVGVETGWLGKRAGKDILVVSFTSGRDDGSTDPEPVDEAVGFWVEDLDGWVAALRG